MEISNEEKEATKVSSQEESGPEDERRKLKRYCPTENKEKAISKEE